MFLHGSLAHSGAWSQVAKGLGRPALSFDLPGHGKSGPWDESREFQDQSLDMTLGLSTRPMDVVGHSYGARVALRLAVERPELVRRLVLIEPVFFAALARTPELEAHRARVQPFNDAIQAGDRLRAAQEFVRFWGSGVDWDQLKPEHQAVMQAQIHLVAAQDPLLYTDPRGVLNPGRLEALTQRCLVVNGGASLDVIRAICNALAGRIPNSQRVAIPAAAHMVPVTHAEALAAELSEFLG